MVLKEEFKVMKLAYKTCTWAIKRNHKYWVDVFEVYFLHEAHPNRLLSQRMYR